MGSALRRWRGGQGRRPCRPRAGPVAGAGAARGFVAKGEAFDGDFLRAATGKIGWRCRVVVAGDPVPVALANDPHKVITEDCRHFGGSVFIMKAVAEADDHLGVVICQNAFEPRQRRSGVVWRQHPPAPGISRPLFQMQVGDDQDRFRRPPQDAAGIGYQNGTRDMDRGNRFISRGIGHQGHRCHVLPSPLRGSLLSQSLCQIRYPAGIRLMPPETPRRSP